MKYLKIAKKKKETGHCGAHLSSLELRVTDQPGQHSKKTKQNKKKNSFL
jgi:hypothetical protein